MPKKQLLLKQKFGLTRVRQTKKSELFFVPVSGTQKTTPLKICGFQISYFKSTPFLDFGTTFEKLREPWFLKAESIPILAVVNQKVCMFMTFLIHITL